ncbi:MAG: methionine adenosyltransferase domain-containing protein, partial ['Waltheria sp.' little leaf phytoplasma]|nr:methionine adenosyltransferase domain-containing protein ['Waltheria sp.' little leaf phytoplasma]
LILETIYNNFDLSPQGISNQLNLTKPIFRMTAKYGHFGIDKNFSRTNSKAASVTAGLGSVAPELANPLVALLCFFRKAAEKPEAHTCKFEKEKNGEIILNFIFKYIQ